MVRVGEVEFSKGVVMFNKHEHVDIEIIEEGLVAGGALLVGQSLVLTEFLFAD